MARKLHYFIIYKPYKVLSQFTSEDGNKGLGALYTLPKDVYPVGRLDLDSEGLLILTNDRKLNSQLLDPAHGHLREYWVQVEGSPSESDVAKLVNGVSITIKGKKHKTKPARVKRIDQSVIPDREPPVNLKKYPSTTWLSLSISEGKNRQVRRMTAAIDHPTLRLVRVAIGNLQLLPLKSGEIRQVSGGVIYKKLGINQTR